MAYRTRDLENASARTRVPSSQANAAIALLPNSKVPSSSAVERRRKQVDAAINMLKQKGLFPGNPVLAIAYYRTLRHQEKLTVTRDDGTTWEAYYIKAQDRAISLLPETDAILDSIPNDVHAFSGKEFQGYTKPLLIDNEGCLAQRSQLSGIFYMHACAVVQYYAIWHNVLAGNPTATSDLEMLDLRWYAQNLYTPTDHQKHVFEDKGGLSENFPKKIPKVNHADKSTEVSEKDMSKFSVKLKQYGPERLADFIVDQYYHDGYKQHFHTGARTGNCVVTIVSSSWAHVSMLRECGISCFRTGGRPSNL